MKTHMQTKPTVTQLSIIVQTSSLTPVHSGVLVINVRRGPTLLKSTNRLDLLGLKCPLMTET